MWSFKPNLFIKKTNTKQKKLHSPTRINATWCKNKWRTLLMGPAQPWHYKMGGTNLFCLRQSGPHVVQRSFRSRNRCRALPLMWGHPRKKDPLAPPLAMHAHPTKLTPQSRVMGDFLQTSVLCSELGLRRSRKSSNSNLHPNPSQLTVGASGSSPTYSTLFENYRHTQQTWLLSSTEGEKEKYKHWAELAEAIKQFNVQTHCPCIAALVVPASTKQLKANEK